MRVLVWALEKVLYIENDGYINVRRALKFPRMTKTYWETFVKCMRQVTKGHLYHLLGVSVYYVMYRQRAQSVLSNVSKGYELVIDPLRGL